MTPLGTSKISFVTEPQLEGSVRLLVPELMTYARGRSEYIPSRAPVFYNPLMSFNRDIAVLVLKTYQRWVNQKLFVCDPFCGCGVRGIRFLKECQKIDQIVFNDRNPQAILLTKLNLKQNGFSKNVTLKNVDANVLLSFYSDHRFDAIDLDPFGSPSPFLDAAVRAIKNEGLLALTATDMAPLCGIKPLACIRKYTGKPLRTEYCHELAVRLLINCLVLTAAKYALGVKILFSHYTKHYVRIYGQLLLGAEKANESINQLGYVTHCFNCLHREYTRGFWRFPPLDCDSCGTEMSVAGPLWIGQLLERQFCEDMLNEFFTMKKNNYPQVIQLLQTSLSEAGEPPTYVMIDKICQKMGIPSQPKKELIMSLREQGYTATPTHFCSRGIKSNASIAVIRDSLYNLYIE